MLFWFAASITPTSFGGIHRSMNVLAAELRHYGHTAHIFYAPNGKAHHRVRFSLSLALRFFFLFWQRPHWIIARSSDGLFCALIARFFRMKTRVALHSHGWEVRVFELERRLPAAIITNPTTWRARLVGFFLLRTTLKFASLCICGTINEARWLKTRYPYIARKLVVVPNGIPPAQEPYWQVQPDHPPSILLVGGFTWKKNLEYGIELFRRLLDAEPQSRLFIVGSGVISESKRQLLYPLGDAVFTVENEAPSKMVRWYESCPVLLFPSRYEGGRPYSILEAQSRGCIVFASDIPAHRECITDGVNGFLIPCVNPRSDAAFIHQIFRNSQLISRVSRSAWKKSLRNRTLRQGQRLIKALLIKTVTKHKPR